MRTLLLASLILPLAACAEPHPEPEHEGLAESLATWEDVREDFDDSYTYVRWTEYWPGRRLETSIVVSSGTVIERSHLETQDGETVEAWSEYGADVGTAETGFPAVTLDALYEQCADEVLPRVGGTIELTFRTFGDGLLMDCYTADSSVDDGGVDGVQLLSIEVDQPCGATVAPCG